MKRLIKRAKDNPKTTLIGMLKFAGAVWYLIANRAQVTPDTLMHPEGLLPVAIILSGFGDLLSADAKDEIRAAEVKPDTTLVGER